MRMHLSNLRAAAHRPQQPLRGARPCAQALHREAEDLVLDLVQVQRRGQQNTVDPQGTLTDAQRKLDAEYKCDFPP